ncbi:MAG: subtilisin family serine protease [Rhodothermales bacterium]|jgi:subtilisin family serine protease
MVKSFFSTVRISLDVTPESIRYTWVEAVREAVAAGIVVVVSAGNDGVDASTYSPAHVAEAIGSGHTIRTEPS